MTLDEIFSDPKNKLGEVKVHQTRWSKRGAWFLPMYQHGGSYYGHNIGDEAYCFCGAFEEDWQIYEEPKLAQPKTRYYQWRVKFNGTWCRAAQYISEDGRDTANCPQFRGCWDDMPKEKLNPETDFVEE